MLKNTCEFIGVVFPVSFPFFWKPHMVLEVLQGAYAEWLQWSGMEMICRSGKVAESHEVWFNCRHLS